MSDVATLICNIELLAAGQPLPDDDQLHPTMRTVGRVRANTAALRCGSLAAYCGLQPVPSRLACEMVDNADTILAALRYWQERHRA